MIVFFVVGICFCFVVGSLLFWFVRCLRNGFVGLVFLFFRDFFIFMWSVGCFFRGLLIGFRFCSFLYLIFVLWEGFVL